MANVTLFVPDDLKKRMSAHKGISWSNAIRTIIESKLEDLDEANELASASMLTEEDVEVLSRKVDEDTRKHVRALKK
ncbi:MAG: hypothetical protein V1835_03560 [Candidatus Micrarchaeota archaeon]